MSYEIGPLGVIRVPSNRQRVRVQIRFTLELDNTMTYPIRVILFLCSVLEKLCSDRQRAHPGRHEVVPLIPKHTDELGSEDTVQNLDYSISIRAIGVGYRPFIDTCTCSVPQLFDVQRKFLQRESLLIARRPRRNCQRDEFIRRHATCCSSQDHDYPALRQPKSGTYVTVTAVQSGPRDQNDRFKDESSGYAASNSSRMFGPAKGIQMISLSELKLRRAPISTAAYLRPVVLGTRAFEIAAETAGAISAGRHTGDSRTPASSLVTNSRVLGICNDQTAR